MSNVIIAKPQSLSPALYGFTKEQVDLITKVVAKGATPDELQFFLYRCQIMQLDPLKPGQIHFIKFGNNPGTIVVGIDGFRTRAARSGKMGGCRRWVIRNEKGDCIGAGCRVIRKDWSEPAEVEVSMNEYDTGKSSWANMPETMIQKVAEAHALRMAFPDDLGGLFIEEEIEKAKEHASLGIHPEQPGEGDGIREEGWVVPGGVHPALGGKVIQKCDPTILRQVVNATEEKYAKAGKPIPKGWQRFIDEATPYIAAWENDIGGQGDGPAVEE